MSDGSDNQQLGAGQNSELLTIFCSISVRSGWPSSVRFTEKRSLAESRPLEVPSTKKSRTECSSWVDDDRTLDDLPLPCCHQEDSEPECQSTTYPSSEWPSPLQWIIENGEDKKYLSTTPTNSLPTIGPTVQVISQGRHQDQRYQTGETPGVHPRPGGSTCGSTQRVRKPRVYTWSSSLCNYFTCLVMTPHRYHIAGESGSWSLWT